MSDLNLSGHLAADILELFDYLFCQHLCLCEGTRSSGAGVTDSCELPCGCWELNPDPLEEQPVLLTSEPSLIPLELFK